MAQREGGFHQIVIGELPAVGIDGGEFLAAIPVSGFDQRLEDRLANARRIEMGALVDLSGYALRTGIRGVSPAAGVSAM